MFSFPLTNRRKEFERLGSFIVEDLLSDDAAAAGGGGRSGFNFVDELNLLMLWFNSPLCLLDLLFAISSTDKITNFFRNLSFHKFNSACVIKIAALSKVSAKFSTHINKP